MYTHAIVRPPANSFAQGISTSGLGAPDLDLARSQHKGYCRALEACGLEVMVLEPLDQYPDSCFVEDTAVLLPEMAVLASPGAPSRQGEEARMAECLQPLRPLWRMSEAGGGASPEASLEGGDVLQVEQTLFIGLSARTNRAGAQALGQAAAAHGYQWRTVEVVHPPHLKTSLTWLGGRMLIATPELAARADLSGYEVVVTPENETYAACCLYVNGTVLMPAGHPGVRAKLTRLGRTVVEVDMTEFAKMDGGLTCLSLRY